MQGGNPCRLSLSCYGSAINISRWPTHVLSLSAASIIAGKAIILALYQRVDISFALNIYTHIQESHPGIDGISASLTVELGISSHVSKLETSSARLAW